MNIETMAEKCRHAAVLMPALSNSLKTRALENIVEDLNAHLDEIIQANTKDLEQAEKDKLEPPLLKRLKFDKSKVDEVCEGIQSLVRLEDPVGKTLAATRLDNGLDLYRVSRPIGVIGVIFESRPDALVQIASLCLKSANAVLLKGGSEAAFTNRLLADIILKSGERAGLPKGWLGLLEERDHVGQMLKLDHLVDLIIPRGSNAFVRYIMDNTHIPVLGHADGICHVYIDKKADLEMALEIAVDSKCQYVAVCNAAETILVHEKVAKAVLPGLDKALKANKVEIVGCEQTRTMIDVPAAMDEDWQTEYLDFKVSVRVVPSLEKAVAHINQYGSGHTDVIVTRDKSRAVYFMDHTDTADAFWNCSSRFSDGFRFGLGAEVGISTHKIHARGPVGLEGLMSYQWRMVGQGHVVKDYTGEGAKPFIHEPLDQDFDRG